MGHKSSKQKKLPNVPLDLSSKPFWDRLFLNFKIHDKNAIPFEILLGFWNS
jgi:hypothetical protein